MFGCLETTCILREEDVANDVNETLCGAAFENFDVETNDRGRSKLATRNPRERAGRSRMTGLRPGTLEERWNKSYGSSRPPGQKLSFKVDSRSRAPMSVGVGY